MSSCRRPYISHAIHNTTMTLHPGGVVVAVGGDSSLTTQGCLAGVCASMCAALKVVLANASSKKLNPIEASNLMAPYNMLMLAVVFYATGPLLLHFGSRDATQRWCICRDVVCGRICGSVAHVEEWCALVAPWCSRVWASASWNLQHSRELSSYSDNCWVSRTSAERHDAVLLTF